MQSKQFWEDTLRFKLFLSRENFPKGGLSKQHLLDLELLHFHGVSSLVCMHPCHRILIIPSYLHHQKLVDIAH